MDIFSLFTSNSEDTYKSKLKLNVIIICVVVLFVFTRIFYYTENNDSAIVLKGIFSILLLGVGVYLSNFYVNVTEQDINNHNKIIDFKLNSLQEKVYEFINYKINLINNSEVNKNMSLSNKDNKVLYKKNELSSLYVDANVIVFLYSIIKLYDYNKFEFYLLLKGTNNILKIRKEIEQYHKANGKHMQNIQEMFEIAIQLKTNCVNTLQNFIYSIPKTKIMYNFLEECIVVYNKLLTRNLDKISKYVEQYVKDTGINTMTRFISYKQTKPFNEIDNYSVIPKKWSNTKLIDLYV